MLSLRYIYLKLKSSCYVRMRFLYVQSEQGPLPTESIMLCHHVSTVAQTNQTLTLDGAFAFLVATVGECETRGVKLVATTPKHAPKSHTQGL